MVQNLMGKKWGKFTLIMIVSYLIGCLIIYTITSKAPLTLVNKFFFEVFGEGLAKLCNTQYDDHFKRIANPVQIYATGVLLFFISKAKKMNKLKGNCFLTQL